MRWGRGDEGLGFFALNIMVGMIIYSFFSESIGRSSTVIRGNTSYVKKIVFPLNILPLVVVFSALFNAIIAFGVFLIGYFVVLGLPSLAIFQLIFLLLSLLLTVAGLSWVISSLGVFFSDLQHLIGTLLTMMMFMSPVFYSITMVPESMRELIYLNPLVYYIEGFRAVLFHGEILDSVDYLRNISISLLIFSLGYKWFNRVSKHFSDVI